MRFRLGLAAIAAVAFAVRVAFVLGVEPEVPDVGDATAYHLLADNLADGRGYIRPFDLLQDGRTLVTAEYPPLHPAVVAVADLVGIDSVGGQRLWLGAIGTGTVVLIGLLGRRVRSPATGLVAAGLAAVYPMLFLSDATLMPETVFGFLVTLLLLLALDATTWRRMAVVGAVAGLATLARSEALLFLPLLVVPLALRRPKVAAAGVAAALAVVLPWSARNYVRFDAVVPVSNNLGSALDGANCERAYEGSQKGLWLFDCFGGFDLRAQDETEAARFHRERGLEYAKDHAGQLPGVAAVRWLRTFGVYDVDQQTFFESFEGRPFEWQRWGTRMWWALAALAIGGGVILRRERCTLGVLLSTVAVVTITTVLTYGNQRFRIAAEPAVLVLAAVALTTAARRLPFLRR